MKFDKDKCLKLLKERKSLQKEGKGRLLSNSKNEELLQYLILLEAQSFWESRKNYYQILDLFSKQIISLDEFFIQYGGLQSSNFNTCDIWEKNLEEEACGILTQSNEIDFQLNPESRNFAKIINDLDVWVDLCDPNITLEMDLKDPESIGYGISEEFFRFLIHRDFIPKLKKYCKKS